jgi:hypothetical protein
MAQNAFSRLSTASPLPVKKSYRMTGPSNAANDIPEVSVRRLLIALAVLLAVSHVPVRSQDKQAKPSAHFLFACTGDAEKKAGVIQVDDAFHDTDGKPGFNFADREWPYGWKGSGVPHGVVFSR